jgi:hypothetical protein
MNKPNVSIESSGDNRWRVRAKREWGGVSATADAQLALTAAPRADEMPHAGYAGARAWLAVARVLNDATRFAEALDAARAGLSELGEHYADRAVVDDTDLKLLAADEQASQNRLDNAARIYIATLGTRLKLYKTRYRDVVLE